MSGALDAIGASFGLDEASEVNPLLGERTLETSAYAQLAQAERAEAEKEKAASKDGSGLLGGLKNLLPGSKSASGKSTGLSL